MPSYVKEWSSGVTSAASPVSSRNSRTAASAYVSPSSTPPATQCQYAPFSGERWTASSSWPRRTTMITSCVLIPGTRPRRACRGRALAGERHRFEVRRDVATGGEPLHEHRAQAVEEIRELDVLVALLGEDLVHGGNGEDAVDGMLERLARVHALGARLQTQERRDRLEVVLHAVMDLVPEP